MNLPRNRFLTVVVRAARPSGASVIEFELVDPDGWTLPPFTAGAHLDVHLRGGHVRSYSLCGDPADEGCYRVAVLAQPDGRGGSLAFHGVKVGDVLSVSLPRNHFPLSPEARRHLFIAGGIGITPFLSMLPVLERAGTPFFLHYCARGRERAAFVDLVQRYVDQGKAALHLDGAAQGRGLDVSARLAVAGDDEHVYCCGPDKLMRAVQTAAVHWPDGTVHFEKFNAPQSRPAGKSYKIVLAQSNKEIHVDPGETMARALQRSGCRVETSCEAGTCGACKTRYLSGVVNHKDFVLKRDERASYLIPCVSESDGQTLVLDL